MKKLLSNQQAVFIGLASMLGAGVFVVFAPAAGFAGNLLPFAVLLAGLVAYLNAMSIAQLARVVTRSGGAYAYARHYISETTGFIAGAAFLIGKLGSVAAIALTFATYLTPGYELLTASCAILMMALINIMGINRTALGAQITAGITVSFLLVVLLTAFISEPSGVLPAADAEPLGVLTAASILFFAFAGYARVATLGEEVENPKASIPKAITISLGIVVCIYFALAVVLTSRLGGSLPVSTTPIEALVRSSILATIPVPVWLFASIAALGSLLALLAGMTRTAATMATDRELPRALSRTNSKGSPWLAELVIALGAMLLLFGGGVLFAIGLSSFAVLVYYAIANWAAYLQPKSDTTRPKWLNMAGGLLCMAIALAVPLSSMLLGLLLLALLLAARWSLAKWHRSR